MDLNPPELADLPPGLLVTAVSGGGDSLALLYLLHDLGREVVVAHFDHRLRPNSQAEADFVLQVAQELGYPCEIGSAPVAEIARAKKQNLEATARELRYAFLYRVAQKHRAQAILTAHNREDNSETLLLQLVRGSGRGLGIAAKQGLVVRPLLSVSGAELRAYLTEKGISWREDPSNQDLQYDRNYLRQAVLPSLRARFPTADSALLRFSTARGAEEPELDQWAQDLLIPDPRFPVPAYRAFPLEQASRAQRRRALRLVLEAAGSEPTQAAIELVEQALAGKTASLPGNLLATRWQGNLFLLSQKPLSFGPLPEGARSAQPGDWLEFPWGRKRLVEFLAEAGVPRELRRLWPVLAQEQQVKWVHGLCPENPDQAFMDLALAQARQAAARGEVPVGAVVVRENQVLAQAGNQVESQKQATAHAELLAIQRAPAKVLPGATLYVTLEPCPMCYGAIREAQIARVVYGTENQKAGAFSVLGLPRAFALQPGIKEVQCAKLLRGFFAARR